MPLGGGVFCCLGGGGGRCFEEVVVVCRVRFRFWNGMGWDGLGPFGPYLFGCLGSYPFRCSGLGSWVVFGPSGL